MKINNTINKHRMLTHILLAVLLAMGACKKKLDFEYDNRPKQTPTTASNTRLVNLTGARELEINGLKLTSFMPPNHEGGYGTPGTMRVTSYFPETGVLGTTYAIPTEFIGADGIIKNLSFASLGRDFVPAARPFNLKDYGRAPMDYYHTWFAPNNGVIRDSMFAIPRDVSPSSNPQHFKIRLINLGSAPDYFGKQGVITLSWADGNGVHSTTTAIAVGNHSAYIELPYGTYQFKVLASDGREIPAKGSSSVGSNVLNPQTGTLMSIGEGTPGHGGFNDSWLSYAPIKTYQPGGVYSIVVAEMPGYNDVIIGSNGETVRVNCNSFQVINDISEPLNNTYARVQAVNVIAGKIINWQIDNEALGSTAYSLHTDYKAAITGNHIIKAIDAQGTVLAEKSVNLLPGDNITCWAFMQKNGQPAITVSANNLSGSYSRSVNGNDGSYAYFIDRFPQWTRFMNFCPDMEEVTFTMRNGTLMGAEGSRHVQFGQQKVTDAYARQVVNFSSDILIYQSTPAVIPGNWINTIAPLKSNAFMANIDLYKTTGKPNSEPGIYTVALIGSTAVNAAEKAKIIVIKHNR